MKRIVSIIFSLAIISVLTSNCGNASNRNAANAATGTADTGTAKIVFKEYEHNFGKVTEGEKVAYVFTFQNLGTASLVIASATASCGCTVPKYDSRPIPPGGDGKLEVVFNTSGRNGIQTKTISVQSNASTPVVLLKIVTEVVNDKN